MRRIALIALMLISLSGLAACQEAPSDAYDNPVHNGYPGPGTREKSR